ncbi:MULTISPECIES: carbohydrate ABC transporter permease [unclassified Streptomyces]|uniref:carbohydrate ABC transporter permease n=1 Tax=Streptomyces TaxID=1883 RepID=UPI0001C19E43|nr:MULTISPECIES: carbohydrate ABC transporter permease [unclassified Streptomyces]AEN10178.1 binding-protein-dependent transport systems inner membrane component [Streptomyces sp. SirexAA-E]MYR66968.1 ABC transporter permease subunit [Streptomyces sp. SID4939]MYR99285.1 ABC transporter permease subunit [Streptomyces sp. SID4940]MYT65330.1 ABC transporter permease subunit [Streptomyces sp. SID8357]MYT84385.1 ABC transporter permease subunit [Streptomyces sp. SID8360]
MTTTSPITTPDHRDVSKGAVRRAEPPIRRRFKPGAGRQHHAGPFAYVALAVVGLGSLFPLYWTLVTASRTQDEVLDTPPPLIPGGRLFDNLQAAWEQAHLGTAILNTFIVSCCITAATLFFCTLAGYAFAKMRFKGRGALMTMVIATLTIPPQLSVVPLFMMMADIGWGGQLESVIFPTLVSAFGVFFMRQYLLEALPYELIEAGRMDGANNLRIVWSIVLPVARPAMMVLGMLTFVQTWNDFFWPYLALNQENPTLQVALGQLSASYVPDQSIIMAGALISTVPLLVVFVIFGKQIVGGIMSGAVKG